MCNELKYIKGLYAIKNFKTKPLNFVITAKKFI